MNATTPHELKGLQTQLAKAQAEVSVSKAEVVAAQKKESQAQAQVRSLQARINELQAQTAEPIISEHAMLRWIERVMGVDLEQVKADMLDERTKSAIMFAKNGKFVKGGVTLIFRNNTIITVE